MRKQRKVEHLNCSLSLFKENHHHFSDIQFIPVELPEKDLSCIDLSTVVFGQCRWERFLYINAITGGTLGTAKVLKQITELARIKHLPLAVGSQSIMKYDKEASYYFEQVRADYPKGFIMANSSASTSVDMVKRFIDVLEANAVQIHLNLAQEAMMHEGDRNFCGYLENLASYADALDVPIIIKAVGYGLTRETYYKVAELGISAIDVSGKSGMNFVDVEIERRPKTELQHLRNWGISTLESLLELLNVAQNVDVFASGGVYDAFSAIKCLSLGAKAIGVATSVLHRVLTEGVHEAANYIDDYFETAKVIMCMLGVQNLTELQRSQLLVRGATREYCILREINIDKYALRHG